LSSTTDPRRDERGQVLVIFAGALVLILAVAALVFDVGQNLLDRRTEQNVSDAAALAGAQYMDVATYTYHGFCSGASPTMPAVKAACDLAAESGYVDGTNGRTVRVDIPPLAPSAFAAFPDHIQVTIHSSRPSFFAGVLGMTSQHVAAMAVATNDSDTALPFSLLALDPHGCGTNKINGAPGTIVSTDGTVHVDSDCSTDAVLLSGNGVLNAPQCDVVGEIQVSGGATNGCTSAPDGVLVVGDPLQNMPAPPKPGLPAAVQPLDSLGNPCVSGVAPCGTIPPGCPGGATPATDAAPALCAFSTNEQKDKAFRIFPGLYPGGIETTRGIVYMSPGIYWIGGGGVGVKSTGGADGRLVSKAAGDNTGMAPSGGVLIYNSTNPLATYGPITLNGGAGATLALNPLETTIYKGMVIFVDRAAGFGLPDDIDLNGGGSILNVTGTIYAPSGTVKFNGSSTDVISAQVICYSFQINGSGASFTIDYDPANLVHVTGVGLVE
jgi:hypothetical protein